MYLCIAHKRLWGDEIESNIVVNKIDQDILYDMNGNGFYLPEVFPDLMDYQTVLNILPFRYDQDNHDQETHNKWLKDSYKTEVPLHINDGRVAVRGIDEKGKEAVQNCVDRKLKQLETLREIGSFKIDQKELDRYGAFQALSRFFQKHLETKIQYRSTNSAITLGPDNLFAMESEICIPNFCRGFAKDDISYRKEYVRIRFDQKLTSWLNRASKGAKSRSIEIGVEIKNGWEGYGLPSDTKVLMGIEQAILSKI